jgi:uncharacterized protein
VSNEQERWLLLLMLASPHAAADVEYFPLDRIRLQKAVFLLGHGSARWSMLYPYRPYNWGPYSSLLARDTDLLIGRGLLAVTPRSGNRYGSYVPTTVGAKMADEAWGGIWPEEQRFVRAVRAFVTGRSFDRLLRDVYSAFPEFATESLFRQ